PERLHPRIALYESYHYKALSAEQQSLLWQIHEDFFYHRHNAFWKESAMAKLPSLIEATDMLVCGEDLGMVPACVPDVMNELGILSLEIQRMPKAMGCEFGDTHTLPYLSICTTGTHDMNPLRAWWQEDQEKTQRYFQQILQHEGEAPATCGADMVREIIALHMQSPAMWTVLPLQDYLACSGETAHPDAQSERINEPVNNHNYWCYRMHIALDDLLQREDFCENIRSLCNARKDS
ncbi:MAG: 4-alpha-glucanotransferase, partial [Bacteroidales bacterium]|nr:4-alpha-glucanotransferase [Bacteroidales bacterium]